MIPNNHNFNSALSSGDRGHLWTPPLILFAVPFMAITMSASEAQGVKSLHGTAEKKLLDLLGTAISDEKDIATFACGGSIPIVGELASSRVSDDVPSSPPVVLRWDPPATNTVLKMTFPMNNADTQNLKRLRYDCTQATFGYGGRNVLDESYPKALQLEPPAFSSNISFHDLGITDVIAQMLLPNARDAEHLRGARAELYKLNVRLRGF